MRQQEEINWLRGFAAFLVVLGHSIIVYPIDLHEIAWCKYLYNIIYSFHMPLFFAVSGYCFSMKYGYKTHVYKKVKRIMIPFAFWAFIEILPRLLLPSMVNDNESIGILVKNNILYGGHYWFLYTMFVVFLLFPIVDKGFEKNIVITTVAVVILSVLSNYLPIIFCLRWAMYYLLFFYIGYLARKYDLYRKCKEMIPQKKIYIGLLAVVALAAIAIAGLIHGILDKTVLNILEGLVGIAACFVLSIIIPKVLKIFGRYSGYSLALYLMNGYWLVVSRTIIVNIAGISNPFIVILFNMLIGFFVSYIFIHYILRKIPLVKNLLGII